MPTVQEIKHELMSLGVHPREFRGMRKAELESLLFVKRETKRFMDEREGQDAPSEIPSPDAPGEGLDAGLPPEPMADSSIGDICEFTARDIANVAFSATCAITALCVIALFVATTVGC